MKLEKHKDSTKIWKDTKISKDIPKKKNDLFIFWLFWNP
jgi:hypothetical protein